MKKISRQSGFVFALAVFCAGLMACRTLSVTDQESYGLPLVEIKVDSEDESVLNSTVWEKTPVPADLNFAGKTSRVDLKYAGKSSLDDFKKNYDIVFRGSDNYQGRRKIKLSAQAVDPSGLRAMLGLWAYRQAGQLSSEIGPASVYLNGKFKGLYFHIENIDEEFFQIHRIERGLVYKAIFGNADFSASTLKDPGSAFTLPLDGKDYAVIKRLSELVLSDAPSASRITQIESIVDVRSMLDYVAVTVAINHFDGFANNYYFYFDRGVGRYRIIPWDLDRIFEKDAVKFVAGETIWGTNQLSLLTLSVPEYKKYYLNRLKSLLTGPLSVAGFNAQIAAQKELVKQAWEHDRVLSARGRTIESEAAELVAVVESWHQLVSADLDSEIGKLER